MEDTTPVGSEETMENAEGAESVENTGAAEENADNTEATENAEATEENADNTESVENTEAAEENTDNTEPEENIEATEENTEAVDSKPTVEKSKVAEKTEKAEKESKWYVLRVVSGKERKIKEYLDKDIIRNGWDKIIVQIFLPVEKVYKVLNGKKVMRERNFYPGYIMMEVAGDKLNDDIIQHVSNISNVMHFLTDGKGSKGNIISLRKAEVNKMLGKVDEMSDVGGVTMSEPFIIGETIKIIDGPFNDFNGVIEEVSDEKKKLKVQVKIFGRATPVELSYMQVEKLV